MNNEELPTAMLRKHGPYWFVEVNDRVVAGPGTFTEVNREYLEGDRNGPWIKEGIGDR